MEFGSSAQVHGPSESSRRRIRVRVSGPVYHPSELESHRIRVPCRVGGPVHSPSNLNESRQSESTSNSVRRPTRVNDPSKSSRHRTRVRVSGPVYHPSENSSHRFGSESAAPAVCPPGTFTVVIEQSFQVIEIQTSSISGRQSGLGRRVYHPPNQYLSSIHRISPQAVYHPSGWPVYGPPGSLIVA